MSREIMPLEIEVGSIKISKIGRERGFVAIDFIDEMDEKNTILLTQKDAKNIIELLATKPTTNPTGE